MWEGGQKGYKHFFSKLVSSNPFKWNIEKVNVIQHAL